MTHSDRPLDNIAACLADLHNDVELLAQEGHPTKRLKSLVAGLRRQLIASTAIRDRIYTVPHPESDNQ